LIVTSVLNNTLFPQNLCRCNALVNEVITSPPSSETVRLLDEISDTLCKVLDAAEFCRNVHSDPSWRAAAERVCIDLGSYVHELNTHYSLYTALKAAVPPGASSYSSLFPATTASSSSHFNGRSTNNCTANNNFTEETLLVGRMLLRDFERYGVHLDGTSRDHMTHLVSTAQALGFAFTQNMIDPSRCGQLRIPGGNEELREAVERLPYDLRRLFRPWQQHKGEGGGGTSAATASSIRSGSIEGLVMSGRSSSLCSLFIHSDDELLRKEAYSVYCTSPRENLKILDELVNTRHEMAALMGFDSYAAYQLDNFSLAATPHAVEVFLDDLAAALKPAADREALKIAEIKRKSSTGSGKRRKLMSNLNLSSSLLLEPWDRDWALHKAAQGGLSEQLARHFEQHVTLEGCLAGLSLLLEKTLKIKIIEQQVGALSVGQDGGVEGEIWAPGVRKLRVVDCTTDAFLGIVYLDLYSRENKFPGAAHFTLRCGKKVRNNNRRFAESSSAGEFSSGNSRNNASETELGGERDDDYQTPVVALVANFRGGGGGGGGSSTNLNYREVETFFHEFGHALNSLLSRTEYQHLSGTRGPQDIIEIPSHVFERFSLDYETMKMLVQLSQNPGSSSTTGSKNENKDVEKMAEMLASAAIGSKREFAALTLQSTISLCAIDQVLHGKNPPTGKAAENEIAELMQKYNSTYSIRSHHGGGGASFGDHHESHRLHPHVRFNHLIGYGSNYYCYLFAQCISSSLWEGGNTTAGKIVEVGAAGMAEDSTSQHWPDGEMLRRQLLEPGGAKPALQYVNDLFRSRESNNNYNRNTTDMLVAVESPMNDGSTNSTTGWYPRFDSLLRHLGI
jgi:mitochondrial intermediate peptidase